MYNKGNRLVITDFVYIVHDVVVVFLLFFYAVYMLSFWEQSESLYLDLNKKRPRKQIVKTRNFAHIWLFPNRRKTHIHPASSWSLKTNVNKDIYWCRINSCFYDVASQSLTEKCVNLFIFSSEIQPRKAICTEFLSRDLDRNQTTNKFAAGVKDPR